ncbi:hypothetical protein CIK04_28035, partial [Vibrio sp. 03_296]|uniref:hypothetical protein n=1 Tax=Vibrio sp. 03_296 TaxID=2024409 RepID=UPI000BC421D1
WSDFVVKIGSKSISNRSEFLDYIRNLHANAAFLVMALSGMRIGELYGISPVYGAQDHIKIGINTIMRLRTSRKVDSRFTDL